MTAYLQPILIAMTVLLIPACTRLAVRSVKAYLDQGRMIAESNRDSLKESTAAEAAHVAELLQTHRTELLGELTEIRKQTQATNGKVAEHDKDIVRLNARTDLLIELALKGKAE